jgi:hypothetical protein
MHDNYLLTWMILYQKNWDPFFSILSVPEKALVEGICGWMGR